MKLTETIMITQHYSGHRGFEPSTAGISDQPIETVIENLQMKGIDINPGYCAKEVAYFLRTGSRSMQDQTALLPLSVQVPDAKLKAFYLRDGKGLELVLQNHNDIKPLSGAIGSRLSGEMGIVAKLSVEGYSKTIDLAIIDKIREALQDTYLASREKEVTSEEKAAIQQLLERGVANFPTEE